MEELSSKAETIINNAIKNEVTIPIEIHDGLKIPIDQIVLYGDVDLSKDKDKRMIKRTKLVNDNGFFMYSNFDYETGKVYPLNDKIRRYNSWDNMKNFKLCHCFIGKPAKIIIYKQYINRKRKHNHGI